jgi:3-oxoacyl-[acyl-carrier-protein] synthase III
MQANRFARLVAVDYALPEREIGNEFLHGLFPEWGVEKIASKTGIQVRRVVADTETALDLGVAAAERLFAARPDLRQGVDALFFCTQSPDFCLPPNACQAQDRLGLDRYLVAFDYNLGCSGFVYALSLAQAYITSGQASRVLCITAETYSKYLAETDKTVRTIFGDAGAAAVVEAADRPGLEGFVFATDGAGFRNLIVPRSGAARHREALLSAPEFNAGGRTPDNLYMDGPAIFQFTLQCVPDLLARCLEKSGKTLDAIDHVVMHQANVFMLEHLRVKCRIPAEKYVIDMADVGNTVSSTIPIALKRALDSGRIKTGDTAFLAGFGVGYSSAACIATIA